MLNESVKPVNDEAWKERCRLLVLENDELMAENEQLRKTIDHQHILLDKYESMLSEVKS